MLKAVLFVKILFLLSDIENNQATRCTSEANVWCNLLPKTSWPLNQPISRIYHAMAAYTRFPNKTDAIYRILLFGGKAVSGDQNSAIDDASSLRDTWTYSPRTHSWTLLELEILPTARYSHSLTTICGSRVVLIGGENCGDNLVYCWGSFSVVNLDDTWMFNGETESWKRMKTGARGRQGKFNIAFPVLGNRSSTCSCNENVYVLDYDGLAVHMWLLKCVNDGNGTSNPEYEWEYIDSAFGVIVLSAAHVDYATSSVYLVTSTVSYYEVLFFNATTRLWKKTRFRNIFKYETAGLMGVVQGYFSNSMTVISTYGRHALAFDTRDGRLLSMSSRSKNRVVQFSSAGSATIGEEMFVYGGMDTFGEFSTDSNMWKLEIELNRSSKNVLLSWRRDNTPVLVPDFFSSLEANHILSTINNHFLYYKGHYDENRPVEGVERNDFWARFRYPSFRKIAEMWILNIETLQWWRYDVDDSPSVLPFTSSVASYDYYMLLGFGLQKITTLNEHYEIASTNEVWLYVDHLRLWVKLKQNKFVPKPRAFASFASLHNSSFLLFGGMSPVNNSGSGKVIVFNDLWMLNVAKERGIVEFKIKWSQLLVSVKSSLFQLSPRFSHSAYYSTRLNSMYVIGGQSQIKEECRRNISLQFNVTSMTWTRHKIQNENLSPTLNYMCQYAGVMLGERIVISDKEISTKHCINKIVNLMRNQSYTSIVDNYCSNLKGIYSLNFEEMKWIRLTANEYPGFNRDLLFSWKDKLISITDSKIDSSGRVIGVMWQLKPSCIAGQYSENFTRIACKICPTGTFSSAGDTSCTVCPKGMTTTSKGCTSVDNCTCITNYCNHGKCVPLLEKNEVLCKCDPGFTDSRCTTPTYYLIGFGAFSLAIIVGLLSGCIRVSWRRQKKALKTAEEDLRKTEKELKEEKEAWSIDRRRLVIKEVIATGGFGIVHCGEYCGGRVAVKRIKPEIAEILKEDAGKEFSIMKIVRHKNIVQFLGAVELPEDPAPAFVVEFMERGSLRAILDDKTVEMDYKRKLCCASDAAEGMQYLHSLDPPRLHRDLKCANLLVDQNWCVKVGDFGCALLLKGTEETPLLALKEDDDDDDDNGIVYATEGDDIPLMSLHQDRLKYSSYTFGTSLWKAPEAILRRGYGTAADVYSYAIVLWEIFTREIPYNDVQSTYKFMSDLIDAIVEGLRPTLPRTCPNDFMAIMTECWNGNPNERPSFDAIRRRIGDMLEEWDYD